MHVRHPDCFLRKRKLKFGFDIVVAMVAIHHLESNFLWFANAKILHRDRIFHDPRDLALVD